MIKKLLNKWKEEWWEKKKEYLTQEHEDLTYSLESGFQEEVRDLEKTWTLKKELLSIQVSQEELQHEVNIRKLREQYETEKSLIMNTLKNELSLLKSNEQEVVIARNRMISEKEILMEKLIDVRVAWEEKRELIEANIDEEVKFLNEKKSVYLTQKSEVEELTQELASQKLRLSSELFKLNSSWESEKSSLVRKIESERNQLSSEQEVNSLLKDRIVSKQAELNKLNADINLQIKTLEAKASPNAVWTAAFGAGVTESFRTMQPLTDEIIKNAKKLIEDKTIMDTILRNSNGNHKKTN